MATIHKEIEIKRNKEFVWDAIPDVGAIHKRRCLDSVVDCKLEGDWRIVTFANGMVARELIVDVDNSNLGLDRICGDSVSANARIARLARWFGAVVAKTSAGPAWT